MSCPIHPDYEVPCDYCERAIEASIKEALDYWGAMTPYGRKAKKGMQDKKRTAVLRAAGAKGGKTWRSREDQRRNFGRPSKKTPKL